MLKICLIHGTSLVRPPPKDAQKLFAYVKERFILSYYARQAWLQVNGNCSCIIHEKIGQELGKC